MPAFLERSSKLGLWLLTVPAGVSPSSPSGPPLFKAPPAGTPPASAPNSAAQPFLRTVLSPEFREVLDLLQEIRDRLTSLEATVASLAGDVASLAGDVQRVQPAPGATNQLIISLHLSWM